MARAVLLLRSAICLVFAWRLHQDAAPTFEALLRSFEPLAFIDGLLALALVPFAIGARWHAGVVAVVAMDGLIEVAAGLAIQWGPGISFFPVTMVVFSGLIAVLGGALGVFQLAEAWRLHRQIGNNAMTVALGFLGLVSIALSAASLVSIPTPAAALDRLVIGLVVQSIAFVAIAFGRSQRSVPVARRA